MHIYIYIYIYVYIYIYIYIHIIYHTQHVTPHLDTPTPIAGAPAAKPAIAALPSLCA